MTPFRHECRYSSMKEVFCDVSRYPCLVLDESHSQMHLQKGLRMARQKHNTTSRRVLPAKMALCAWNSLPLTQSVTSLKEVLSYRLPMSSLSLHSGTFTGVQLDWPDTFTVSPTTLTWRTKSKLFIVNNEIFYWQQNIDYFYSIRQ